MSKTVRFCYKLDYGNFVGYAAVPHKSDTYQIDTEKYKLLQDAYQKIVMGTSNCKSIEPITLNEYLDNTDEGQEAE